MEVWVHTLILPLDRQDCLSSCHRHCTTNMPHEHEAGRTSDTAWMFWRPHKVVPLPEFDPRFVGRAAHSPNTTMPNPSSLCVNQHGR